MHITISMDMPMEDYFEVLHGNSHKLIALYNQAGIEAFPLEPGGKTPIVLRDADGKPREGQWGSPACFPFSRWAFADVLAEVEAEPWKWPPHYNDANVGIRTGTEDGIYVIDRDYDPENDIDAITYLDNIIGDYDEGREYDNFIRCETPSGGEHDFFFCPPEHLGYGNVQGHHCPLTNRLTGVDARGYHGYVVAPGSCRDGTYYKPIGYQRDGQWQEFPETLEGFNEFLCLLRDRAEWMNTPAWFVDLFSPSYSGIGTNMTIRSSSHRKRPAGFYSRGQVAEFLPIVDQWETLGTAPDFGMHERDNYLTYFAIAGRFRGIEDEKLTSWLREVWQNHCTDKTGEFSEEHIDCVIADKVRRSKHYIDPNRKYERDPTELLWA